MQRAVWLLALAAVAAGLGAASARADGGAETTTTTSTTTPSYAPLSSSSLSAACAGAGAAALVFPSHAVTVLGTPGSSLGPSAYGSVLAFAYATSSGSTCTSASVTLGSVSLFDGAVTASSVAATNGRGSVAGLAIDGSPAAGTASVDGWGEVELGVTDGRVSAPLVVRLFQAHDGLPAGTEVMVGFGATARPVAKPTPKPHRPVRTGQRHAGGSSGSRQHAAGAGQATQPTRQPPDYPAAPNPLLAGGGLSPAAKDNPVVSIAMRYLGVPYEWGGATPKTGFDCSGLVQYVFGKLGVYLPHYSAAQYYSPDAVWVRPTRLQPGDLVFFTGADGTRKAPGHVGIYVGDGYLIDAPHTGSFVRIDSLNGSWFADEYVGAKRIVGVSLDAHVTKNTRPVRVDPLVAPPRMAGLAFGPGPLIAAVRASARATAGTGYGLWSGAGLGCLLLLCGGAFAYCPRPRDRLVPPAR
jgi:cell wall-associated NlpC family hydrolase